MINLSKQLSIVFLIKKNVVKREIAVDAPANARNFHTNLSIPIYIHYKFTGYSLCVKRKSAYDMRRQYRKVAFAANYF